MDFTPFVFDTHSFPEVASSCIRVVTEPRAAPQLQVTDPCSRLSSAVSIFIFERLLLQGRQAAGSHLD